jgi:hypothetical protein
MTITTLRETAFDVVELARFPSHRTIAEPQCSRHLALIAVTLEDFPAPYALVSAAQKIMAVNINETSAVLELA